jgi:hypothetical protein
MELVGHWRKVTEDRCAQSYPDALELRPDGTYRGAMDPASPRHPLWDVGSYAPEGKDAVRISTANDARIRYTVTDQGDTLTFTDPSGCRIQYRRRG